MDSAVPRPVECVGESGRVIGSHMSEHFSELEWAVFARHTNPETAAGIQSHLDRNCESCVTAFGFWRLLGDSLRAPIAPSSSLERAWGWPSRQPLHALWDGVRLAFDSFAFSPSAAVRSGRPARRHCVYELGDATHPLASVEVMTERISSQGAWSVVGQIIDASGAGRSGCPVRFGTPQAVAAGAARFSSAFGEFAFECADAGPWALQVELGGRQWDIAPVLTP
jgi:hypothetical protein